MKYIAFLFTAITFFSCTEEEKVDEPTVLIENKVPVDLTKVEIVRHIEGQLKILGNEKYSYKIYEAQLNTDDSIDRIVTVNLLDRAINEAIESGRVAKRAEVGYIGNFNYIFYIDGMNKAITSPIAIPSSPQAELKINFENIISDANKDFTIDLRIKNSCFRRFYMIENSVPVQISETEIFTDYGTDNEKAYFIEYEPGTHSLAKNIVIYKGIAEEITFGNSDDIYSSEINIQPTKELVRRWYYSPQYQKYYVKNDEL